jgi:hypothetical protein
LARKKIVTPEATASYPALFEARKTPDGELNYSICLIFDNKGEVAKMEQAAWEVATECWGAKAKSMGLRMPFRDGAEKAIAGYGPGKVFVNMKTNRKPGVVSKYAGPDGKPLPIADPSEIYPGCRVRVSATLYTYDRNGNRGVAFGLENVQKLADGPRIDGRLRAEDEFEASETAPTDFDDGGADEDPMAA